MGLSKKIMLFAAGLCAALEYAGAASETLGDDMTKPLFITEDFRAIITDLESPAAGAEKKHDAYTRLARLLYLYGDVERAAAAWENAAYADPERRDDSALAESAVCYVSIGDWDKADAIVKLLLLTSRDDKNISARAVFLNGQVEILRNGNQAALNLIAGNPEYLSFRPAIYYTLWQFSGDDAYKAKLLTEFPDSPEACSVADGANGSKLVSTLETAHWLLSPGRGEPSFVPAEDLQARPVPANPPSPAAAKMSSPAPVKAAHSLQTGLYKKKENAALQAERLKADGFNAALSPRVVGGNSYWAVSVKIPDGATMKNTIARLKEQGFDAFPASPQAN
ncbi:MAG: SPOR domain-containing protein [Spirochaetaceae bacterium]|jgi:tetratricopeptide (TPR) repeat protein|nr:SPOR domain-containing protein [Spirochaetaceae bacterium]